MTDRDVTPIAKVKTKKKAKRRTWPSPADMGREVCEGRVAPDCTGRATESHHIKMRSRGGSDEPDNLAALCAPCHRFCHLNVILATDLGLMRHGWE